jgi:hypothetical protein
MAADVEVVPADLRFRFALNRQLLSTITINNPLESRVGFKIKTTAPRKYVVRPSSGIAEPRSSVSVQVIMQAQKEYPPDFANCKDKFMVQLVVLGEEEQIDKDTFNKDVRRDLREARLRVILDGPAAPPSPVPEAHVEGHDGDQGTTARAASGEAGPSAPAASPVPAAAGGDTARLRSTLNDLSTVSSENTQLKVQLDRLSKERDELRKKLDMIELQAGTSRPGQAVKPTDPALRFRVTIVHIILVAIIAFLVGHYT